MRNLANVVDAYLVCMLWSTTDESTPQGGEPMDEHYGIDDITPAARHRAEADCASFLVDMEMRGIDSSWWTDEQLGHDIWLTRSGHGAGFWDRGQGEAGEQLAQIAKEMSSIDYYVGDDGKIHCQ